MFNQISKTYDLINRFITFGMDINWRNAMINLLPTPCSNLLDIASGTMDVAISATKKRPDIQSIIALDMAEDMLSIGEKNANNSTLKPFKKGCRCASNAHLRMLRLMPQLYRLEFEISNTSIKHLKIPIVLSSPMVVLSF